MPEYNIGEPNSGNMVADIGKLLRSPVFWIKILELLLIFLMIALTVNGGYYPSINYPTTSANMSRSFVVFGTMYAYLILNVIIIAGFILDEMISKKIVLVLTGAGGVLFVTAGALMIEYWDITDEQLQISDLTLGGGILGIIIGAIYLADTAYTFKFA